MKYLFLLITLLIAGPALATNDIWVSTPGGVVADACQLINHEVCYLDTAQDGASPMLRARTCTYLTATIVSDISDNSLSTNTAQVFRFFGAGATVDGNDDAAIAVKGGTLNGVGSTDTDSYYGFDAPYVYFRFEWTSGTMRAIVQCFR